MRFIAIIGFVLVGCGPAEAIVTDASDLYPASADADADADTDTDTDTDADTDTDTDVDTESPAPTTWTGARSFSGWCTDAVEELGIEVTQDPAFVDQVAACPGCDTVFRLEVSPDKICDWIDVVTPTYRGLTLGSQVRVWRIEQRLGGGWVADVMDNQGVPSANGTHIEYAYSSRGLDVVGVVDFNHN